MSESSSTEVAKKKGGKPKSHEEILMRFQKLRGEQRFLLNKLFELDSDLLEHKSVIDTLKVLEGNRKCFKLVGGILCERTVKDVLPEVRANEQQLTKVIESLNQQLVMKGTEINAYKDEHNIIFKNVDEVSQGDGESKSSDTSSAGVFCS